MAPRIYAIRKPRSQNVYEPQERRSRRRVWTSGGKSIARGEDENNVIHHDKNQVVVLDKMEFVAEQAFLATARAVKSELDYASEEFRLYSALNEVSKNAFERCAKDISNVRVFAEKIADTETKIHSCIVPTIEALEEQVELFEATVRNAEKKCDKIDARIAQLHV